MARDGRHHPRRGAIDPFLRASPPPADRRRAPEAGQSKPRAAASTTGAIPRIGNRNREDSFMNKDQVKGRVEQAKGSVKEDDGQGHRQSEPGSRRHRRQGRGQGAGDLRRRQGKGQGRRRQGLTRVGPTPKRRRPVNGGSVGFARHCRLLLAARRGRRSQAQSDAHPRADVDRVARRRNRRSARSTGA